MGANGTCSNHVTPSGLGRVVQLVEHQSSKLLIKVRVLSFPNMVNSYFEFVVLLIFNLVPLIICIAFYTVAERKMLAAIQRRVGPNVVGFWGLLQPFADGVKLIFKEIVIPSRSNAFLFVFAPILTFAISLISWTLIPFSNTSIFIYSEISLPLIFALSSLGVYGIVLAGWSSNSRYAFLGALRSTAQMVSYEVSLMICILPVVIMSGSFNLVDIVNSQSSVYFMFPLLPLFIIFCISAIAETNRTPFDLPEAEAELVAGFNVEYSSISFALFFLGEYSNMMLMAALCALLFLGGWVTPTDLIQFVPPVLWTVIKIIFFCFMLVFIRGNVPRYRYDQLMTLGWTVFLPLTTVYLIFVTVFLLLFNVAPINEYLSMTNNTWIIKSFTSFNLSSSNDFVDFTYIKSNW